MSKSAHAGPNRDDAARAAILRLLDRQGDGLYSFAAQLWRRRQDAEDLVQDVFVHALRSWRRFQGRSKPRTWLYSIAVRHTMRRRRRLAAGPRRTRSLYHSLPTGERPATDVTNGSPGVPSQAAQREEVCLLQEAVARLPDADRIPLVLNVVLELSIRDVAAILGRKAPAVKAHIRRTRQRVAQATRRASPAPRAAPAQYDARVLLDLIDARDAALKRGVPFAIHDRVVCQRCNAVLDALTLSRDVCRQCEHGKMPPEVRQRLRDRISAAISRL